MPLTKHLPAGSAAELVTAVPQPDDAGASTADRYEWQAAMATADGLSLYLGALTSGGASSETRILCEYHEDWVIIRGDDAEIVSAKHREASYGAFTTYTKLAKDGGIGHLFERWYALSEKPTCRLVTTCGLDQASVAVAKAIDWLNERLLAGEPLLGGPHDDVVAKMSDVLPADEDLMPPIVILAPLTHEWARRDRVARFLAGLTLQVEQIRRTHLPYAAPGMFAQPIIDHLQVTVDPEVVWTVALGVFRQRMRAAGPVQQAALPVVLPQVLDASAVGTPAERSIAARLVTTADLEFAIEIALQQPKAYLPLPRLKRTSTVALKMEAGKCSDNSIERAEELRLYAGRYWSDRMSGDPRARAERERVRMKVLGLTDATADGIAEDNKPWGQVFWGEIQKKLAELAANDSSFPDADVMLGGVCELANECRVWFSSAFDVESYRSQLEET
ncbi:hypothetical protein [Kribbella endophytica]